MKYLAIASLVFLGACSNGARLSCPALAPYSPAVQNMAAVELNSLPRESVIAKMIEDYGDLRARIRAACK